MHIFIVLENILFFFGGGGNSSKSGKILTLEKKIVRIITWYKTQSEPGSVATGYVLDGKGIESRCRRDFPHPSRTALGPTQPPIQWVLGLSRGKERPRRHADPSPPTSTVVKKEYRILLLLLLAVRPVENLSACTRVHFTLPYKTQNLW